MSQHHLSGKRGSRRHPTTSFHANFVVGKKRYQMLEVLSFCDRESAQHPFLKMTMLAFLVRDGKMKLSVKSIF